MSLLHRLVYVSRNTLPADADPADEIARILRTSRSNNARAGISGALMFNEGVFAQVLEGELPTLEGTFERIQCDERHGDVRILQFGPVPERCFDAWSMAWSGRSAAAIPAFAALATDTGFDVSRLGGDRVLALLLGHLDEGTERRRAA